MKTFIDFVYSLLIAAAVALFVGLGIWTFYSGPKYPEYPNYPGPTLSEPTEAQNKEFQQRQDKYDQDFKKYENAQKTYSKTVAWIALGSAVVFYLAGGWVMRRNHVIGEGFALGGVFTTIYAAIQAAIGQFKQLVFGTVSLILVMLILLVLYRMRLQNHFKAH